MCLKQRRAAGRLRRSHTRDPYRGNQQQVGEEDSIGVHFVARSNTSFESPAQGKCRGRVSGSSRLTRNGTSLFQAAQAGEITSRPTSRSNILFAFTFRLVNPYPDGSCGTSTSPSCKR